MTEVLTSTTIFSLNADAPTALPAPSPGSKGTLDTAVLVGESDRCECRIRRFSAAGATLDLSTPLIPGDVYILELKNGQAIEGTISWSTDGEAGFAFDHLIDVVGTLARNLAILPAERRHVPRVELHQTVGIRCGSEFELARTRDISQGGVGVHTRLQLSPDDKVHIALDGLAGMHGVVRWAHGGNAGIAFEADLAWQVLMPWLRHAQKSPPRIGLGSPARGLAEEAGGFGLAADKNALRVDAPARVRQGARWWNVQVRHLTAHLVEFEAEAHFPKGSPLWVALPGMSGWPATVIDGDRGHYLAEFRLPLRKHDLAMLGPMRRASN